MPFSDIFNANAFHLVEMTAAVNKVPFKPSRLGELGIFTPRPLRTEVVGIEEQEGTLSLIQTSPRGAPLAQRKNEKRKVRYFQTNRIAKQDHIESSELQFVREFNTDGQVKALVSEMARRMSGPAGLVSEVELTWESHRMGAVQGKVLDADGSVIIDWFDEWGITEPALIDFDLDNASPASGALRKKCQQVVRTMEKAAKGARYGVVHGLCGEAFWDDLIAHPEVRETYKNWVAAAELRGSYDNESFYFGGILFERYRGTDDGSTVAVNADHCRFFPGGSGNGVFEVALSPGESFSQIGAMGQPLYSMVVPDRERDMWVDLEVYSYPLFICKRPEMLLRGKRT